jgi:hypothetical protein
MRNARRASQRHLRLWLNETLYIRAMLVNAYRCALDTYSKEGEDTLVGPACYFSSDKLMRQLGILLSPPG